jgi:hypothetical protein
VIGRVSTFRGSPEQLEEGFRIYREQVSPWLRDATGFRGWLGLLDREGGKAVAISFWATRENAESVGAGAAIRDEVAATVGTPLESAELFEVYLTDALELDADSAV